MKKPWQLLLTSSVLTLVLAGGAFAQSDVVVPGDNLVVEGVPAIPTSLAEGVARYTEFRSAGLLSWHPTQREMLISTRFGDTAQVHMVKMPGGARTQMTFFRERVGGASYRPKTGSFFVFSKDIGGNEFFQNYRYDLADGTITLLSDGKSRNTDWIWSHGGDWAVYNSTRRNGKDTDLYIINPSEPKSDRQLLQLEGGGWSVTDWSADDHKLLLEEVPDAIHFQSPFAGIPTGEPARLIYFSFATLTTVGYGDAYPVHRVARSLAMAEALIGQLYPAILIATLVGMAVQVRSSPETTETERNRPT